MKSTVLQFEVRLKRAELGITNFPAMSSTLNFLFVKLRRAVIVKNLNMLV